MSFGIAVVLVSFLLPSMAAAVVGDLVAWQGIRLENTLGSAEDSPWKIEGRIYDNTGVLTVDIKLFMPGNTKGKLTLKTTMVLYSEVVGKGHKKGPLAASAPVITLPI